MTIWYDHICIKKAEEACRFRTMKMWWTHGFLNCGFGQTLECFCSDTLWLTNITMENHHFQQGLHLPKGGFSIAMLVYRRVLSTYITIHHTPLSKILQPMPVQAGCSHIKKTMATTIRSIESGPDMWHRWIFRGKVWRFGMFPVPSKDWQLVTRAVGGRGGLRGSPISANDTQVVSESGLKAGPSLKMRPFADLGWTHGWPTTLTLELFNVQVSSNWPTLQILEATSFDQAQLPADAKEKLLKHMKTVPGCPSGAANWKLITWTLWVGTFCWKLELLDESDM